MSQSLRLLHNEIYLVINMQIPHIAQARIQPSNTSSLVQVRMPKMKAGQK